MKQTEVHGGSALIDESFGRQTAFSRKNIHKKKKKKDMNSIELLNHVNMPITYHNTQKRYIEGENIS